MNKNFLLNYVSWIVVVLIPCSLYSQGEAIDTNSNGIRSHLAVASSRKPVSASNDIPVIWNSVNTRAIKDFKRMFKHVSDEQWFEMTQTFVATFSQSNTKHRVVYSKKGLWLYTIKYYTEKELPREIRSIVKSTYYDHAITQVEEVHQQDNVIYVVHLQDETGWINVSVCNGQMGILQKILKIKP